MSSLFEEPLISEGLDDHHDHHDLLLSLQGTMTTPLSEDQRLQLCRAAVSQIYNMLRDRPRAWRSYIALARSVIAHLDSTGYMQRTEHASEHAWIVNALQRIAFADADNGPITDLDTWTARQWLQILQRDARNVIALRGMGWAWLQRAQPALSRIHRLDGSSSSSGGSSQQALAASILNGDEDKVMEQANAEAERRAGTADYVEARGFLQPSTEYLARAVAAALSQDIRSGDLLSTAAESFMSMGNASSPRVNEPYFRRAVQLLRAANNVEGFTLPSHLQHYLDDFGRLVD